MGYQSGALRSGLFRTFDIGWLVGVDGGCPERSFAKRLFPNIRHRVVGGD